MGKLEDLEWRADCLRERVDARIRADAQFREEDHPRAKDGKFGNGGGGSITSTDNISSEEAKVLEQYGSGNSYNINKFLRDPKQGRIEAKKNFGSRANDYVKSVEKDAKIVEKAISKSKLTKDVKLFRGVSDFEHLSSVVEGLNAGDTFSLSTFSSTSRDEKWAKDFMKSKNGEKGGMLVIEAKKGAAALDMDEYARHKSEEQEVLFGRNTKYKLDRYDAASKTIFVTVES